MTNEEACNTQSRTTTFSLEFDVCTSHGHARPTGVSVESGGAPTEAIVDSALNVLVQLLAVRVSEDVDIQAYLERDHGGTFGALNEAERIRVLRAVGHALLLKRLSGHGYAMEMDAFHLEIPIGD